MFFFNSSRVLGLWSFKMFETWLFPSIFGIVEAFMNHRLGWVADFWGCTRSDGPLEGRCLFWKWLHLGCQIFIDFRVMWHFWWGSSRKHVEPRVTATSRIAPIIKVGMAVNCALCSHVAYFKLVDALQAYCIWTIIDPDMICDYSIRSGNDVRLCIGFLSLLGLLSRQASWGSVTVSILWINKAFANGYDTVFLLSIMYVVCTMYVSYSWDVAHAANSQ